MARVGFDFTTIFAKLNTLSHAQICISLLGYIFSLCNYKTNIKDVLCMQQEGRLFDFCMKFHALSVISYRSILTKSKTLERAQPTRF